MRHVSDWTLDDGSLLLVTDADDPQVAASLLRLPLVL